jgi:hypothetical protein
MLKPLLTLAAIASLFTVGAIAQQIEVTPFRESQPQKVSLSSPKNIRQYNSYLLLVPTNTKNRFGNPIYHLEMYVDDIRIGSVNAVSGRATTQGRDRNQSGAEAPLPNGKYWIARSPILSNQHEVGGKFLAIEPTFLTGRRALGIHVDPSFEVDLKEDGTQGCIGTTTTEGRDIVYNFIKSYRPTHLDVKI